MPKTEKFRFNDIGLTGPNFMAMSKIGEKYVLEKILPGSDPKKRFFTWQENIKYIQQVSFLYLRNYCGTFQLKIFLVLRRRGKSISQTQ